MNNDQSINLVKETFESPFDRSSFIYFIKNLLNEYEEAEISRKGVYIPAAFEDYISKFERLGKYIDSNQKRIDILVVYLKRETSIERARSMLRNFIAGYLQGKYGSSSDKDAALVAFVSPPNGEEWRFSLVKLETKLEENSKGGMKPVDEFTPARRWSFLVGKNEKSHTAQSRLVPIIADDEHDPTLERLEDAFNIEKVTKEFFEKYRDLFIRTKEELDNTIAINSKAKVDFESKGIDSVNLAKKLLGQIIFLYYLQKKGWFGVPRDSAWGQGSKSFLRDLFDKKHGSYDNFFNDILEPLFYDALRNDRSYDDHYYKLFECKIPFLNGGLFDPMNDYDWVHTDILLSDSLFSNDHKTKEGDTGDGILDIFDRYNFTVNEDEPFEKEVAIDPELLGKAYEKFNAIRPDNFENYLNALRSDKGGEENKFNRQYGVYYTPREIVHYMCQQSLINYLENELVGIASKEEIETLVLHGEYIDEHDAYVDAKGKETITYSFKMSEAIRKNAVLIDDKLAKITVCDPAVGSGAFPVGMMGEIVKARRVLGTYSKTVKPQYDYKRECIENSLYGVDIDKGAVEIAKLRLWLSLVVDEDDPKNIKPLPNLDYKILCGNSLIGFPEKWGSTIEQEIESLIHQHLNETKPSIKIELKNKIDEKIDSRYKNSLKTFGYQINFDFKTVFSEIFREKGGFDILIANPPYDVYQGDRKNEINVIRKMPIYGISEGHKLNAYKIFLAKSITLQKCNGILCEIFQNSFLADSSATKLRKYFLENQRIIQIDSFPERDNEKLRVFEEVKMSVCIMISKKIKKQGNYNFNLNIWEDKFMNSSRHILLNNIEVLGLDIENASIPSLSQAELNTLKKISANKRLISYAKCYEGEINLTFHKYLLNKNPSGSAPMIKGAAVQKWFIKEKMSQGEIEYLDSVAYLQNNKGKKSQHHKLKRIVMQGITGVDENNRLKMTLISPNVFCGNSVNYILITDKNLSYEFLLGVLNSHLLNWYFKVFSTNSNVNGYEVDNLPLPDIAGINQEPLSNLVDQILNIKRANPLADISDLQAAIDQEVNFLYGLKKEEVKLIERE